LATVGRVPLGRRHRGTLHIRWNLRVSGHRLGNGRYVITLRGFDRNHNLIGTTRSATLDIR
jgi:hypothetical protein